MAEVQKSLSRCYQDCRARFFKYHFSIFIPNKYCSRSLERGVTVMMMIKKGLPWLSALHSPSSTHMALCMCCQTGLPFTGQRPSNPDVSARCTEAQQPHSKDRPAGMMQDNDVLRPRCQLPSPQSSQTHTRTKCLNK